MSFFQPPFFNYVIMTLYAINVFHHLIHWRIDGVAYWTAAAAITAAVTWQDELRNL